MLDFTIYIAALLTVKLYMNFMRSSMLAKLHRVGAGEWAARLGLVHPEPLASGCRGRAR